MVNYKNMSNKIYNVDNIVAEFLGILLVKNYKWFKLENYIFPKRSRSSLTYNYTVAGDEFLSIKYQWHITII